MAQLLAGPSLTTASPSWDIVTVGVTTVFVEKILCLSLQEARARLHIVTASGISARFSFYYTIVTRPHATLPDIENSFLRLSRGRFPEREGRELTCGPSIGNARRKLRFAYYRPYFFFSFQVSSEISSIKLRERGISSGVMDLRFEKRIRGNKRKYSMQFLQLH